ncbi:MAG: MFS transporter [Candidatus Dormibacteraeota bacterium]|nr:MFS transporter [Candidatus Dormibacteraeota bacterium]
MGSVIATPLYALYQRKFGFSEITLTLIYAVYVAGNIVALVLFGQISDQLGRKRVALPALGIAAMSAALFILARSALWLFFGRVLIGLAVGVLSGTGTAWLAEQYGPSGRPRSTLMATTSNLCGVALGPLLAGLIAQYSPWPLILPFAAYCVALVIVATAIAHTTELQETHVRKVTDVRLQPRLGVPREKRRAFAAPAVTGFVIFALGGLYFALIPITAIRDLHQTNIAVGGGIVFEFGLVAVVIVLIARRLAPRAAMTGGLVLLLPAVALVVVAQAASSSVVLIVATALAGSALALGYRGSLDLVNQLAPSDRRSEVISTYFIACFLGTPSR